MASGGLHDVGENNEQRTQQIQNLVLLSLAVGLVKTHLEERELDRHLMNSGLPPFQGAGAILDVIHTLY